MLSDAIRSFISQDVLTRFCRYVQMHTTSDAHSPSVPSTECQKTLLMMLKAELEELGIAQVTMDERFFLYATLPARERGEPFGLLAHVDTSSDQSGKEVVPQLHHNWDGSPITYPDDPELTLTVEHSSVLKKFIGDTIITASGQTLLGADDKAGVAEIMTALAAFQRFPELPHGEISVCFTHDEEIGRGIDGIQLQKLPKYCYTMDGGEPGELEEECFDAFKAVIHFQGIGVHPGYAKNKMINAVSTAARFIAALPEAETPEHTEKREGFFHVNQIKGNSEEATVELFIRDFERKRNEQRIELLHSMKSFFEARHKGIVITLTITEQYKNMRQYLLDVPHVVERAARAIEATGLTVIRKPIRGGTDGSRLSEVGHPTPNIFAGGLLFHSRREWIAHSALVQAVETIIHLARFWLSS